MYVLSVCTALNMPSPALDTALTLTSYSVSAASLVRLAEFGRGEPETMCGLTKIVVPCILYWRMYWEMGSSLCGMVQVACKAGNRDDTALDRDRPVTWEGTSKTDRRKYVKIHYHRYNTCSTFVYSNTKTQAERHVHSFEETAPKPPENSYHQVPLQDQVFPYWL